MQRPEPLSRALVGGSPPLSFRACLTSKHEKGDDQHHHADRRLARRSATTGRTFMTLTSTIRRTPVAAALLLRTRDGIEDPGTLRESDHERVGRNRSIDEHVAQGLDEPCLSPLLRVR